MVRANGYEQYEPPQEPGQNSPTSHLDASNGAFKVGPKASPRRLQVQNQGDRGLGGAVGPLQSAIRHHVTPFRSPASLKFWSHYHPWESPGVALGVVGPRCRMVVGPRCRLVVGPRCRMVVGPRCGATTVPVVVPRPLSWPHDHFGRGPARLHAPNQVL